MFSELDETIKQILIKEGGFDPAEIEVSFDIPNREWSAGISKPTVNCYLFDIRENRDMQQTGMLMERQKTNGNMYRQRPPLRLDMTYLITAWTRAVEDEHRLLWHIFSTLMRCPVLPEQHLPGVLREHELPIYTSLARAEGVLKSPGEFWTALENQIKPSLSFVVTLAVDRDKLPTGAPVAGATTRYTRTDPEDEKAGRGIRPGHTVQVSTGMQIGGVVRDTAGHPLAGVALTVEGSAAREVVTGADGGFVLPNVQPGPVTLRIARPGGTPTRVEMVVPSDTYEVVLE